METKNSLQLYKMKQNPKWEEVYNGSWESSLLFKAKTNSLEVNERRKRWGETIEHCEKCGTRNERVKEDIRHLLIECEMYREERRELEEKNINNIGREKWEEIKNEENEGVDYILGLHMEQNKKISDTKRYLGKIQSKRRRNETVNGNQSGGNGNDNNYHGRQ